MVYFTSFSFIVSRNKVEIVLFQKVIDNGMGSKNNLVTVKMSDFEVFQALAKDSEGVHSSAQTEYSQVFIFF